MRRAKIIATLGPASSSDKVLKSLIENGVNVFRLNMSHGKHDVISDLIKRIRKISKEISKEVGLLLDLQGPKIRVSNIQEKIVLKKDEIWFIGHEDAKNKPSSNFIPSVYKNLVNDCEDNTPILFDDGKISAVTTKKYNDEVYEIKILDGGSLSSHKGINIPECSLSAPAFTEKDRDDLYFGLEQGVDFVALSFVRSKQDVMDLKSLLHSLKVNIPVISKIEKPQAIEAIDEILEATDMIMVARGDMGVELGNHKVPRFQKMLINKCNKLGTPVITATQMLESMTNCPTPTRAEASDVANAIWDGTDAVMLSGETAMGEYPLETIKMMDQIVLEAESHPKPRPYLREQDLSSVNSAVVAATSVIAENIEAQKIVCMTESGNSVLKITKFRPKTPVLAITTNINVVRKISLFWGVDPFLITDYDEDTFNFHKDVVDKIKNKYSLVNGDKLVISRGDGKFFVRGTSNSIKVEIISEKPTIAGSSEVLLEEKDKKKRILLDTSICASCQNCIQICPHDIWQATKNEYHSTYINKANIDKCSLDMECIRVCPTGAIEIIPTT